MNEFLDAPLPENENVLLVDLNNLCIRNLFVQAYDPTDVSHVGYKIAMLKSIRKLARMFKPNRMIFCMESYDGNWRKEIYPEYKANRSEVWSNNKIDFDNFFKVNNEFIEGLKKVLKNCQFLTLPHLEADDLIALTVMTKPEWNITLVSTDKDFYQLHAYKNFKQYNPIKEEYIEVINPEAALLEKIVMGDRSDNIPTLKKGVGPKTFNKIYTSGFDSWIAENNLQENLDRNTKLISFKCIPHEHKDEVRKALDAFNKEPIDAREMYNLVIGFGLGAFLPEITDFINNLKN